MSKVWLKVTVCDHCYGCSASKLPEMTIFRWILIQESSFYPHYLCRTREETLDEEKDGISLSILLSLNTSFFHSHGLYKIILSLFSLSRFHCLSFWLSMLKRGKNKKAWERRGKTPSTMQVKRGQNAQDKLEWRKKREIAMTVWWEEKGVCHWISSRDRGNRRKIGKKEKKELQNVSLCG